jgi:hypothetical protein
LLISSVSSRSRKRRKEGFFCAALEAGTVNKLEQSILRLLYLWLNQRFALSSSSSFYKNTRDVIVSTLKILISMQYLHRHFIVIQQKYS